MLIYNQFNIKVLFFLSLILILKFPINTLSDLIIVILSLFIILFSEIRKKFKIKYFLIISLIASLFLLNLLDKKKINEAHSIFFSQKDIKVVSTFLPSMIIDKINNDYLNKFDLQRALKSYDSPVFSSKESFENHQFIEKPYAFSSDNFFQRSKFSRKTNSINFKTREDLKIGQINTIGFNLVYDSKLRRNLPYYILYELPPSYYGSNICGQGNIYYSINQSNENIIKNLKFNELKNDCIKLDSKNSFFYILGYSIYKEDKLEILLKNNIYYEINNYFLIFIKLFFIVVFFLLFFKIKNVSKYEYLVFLFSILATLFFIYLKDFNLITGLRYYRGGGDGLFHESQGYMILNNIYNLNFIEALRGGEDIFYNMPGLRYFLAINKFIFGENSYGYVLITSMLPFFLYKFLKNLVSDKIAFYLILSFLFIPIFENMGFGHFNYVHQLIRNHAETLSITILVYCLYKISETNFKDNLTINSSFIYCFLLAICTFCRPNFFPTCTIIFIYIIYTTYKKNYVFLLSSILGYSFVNLSFFHNIYFGNNYSFFTLANIHFAFMDIFQSLNYINSKDNILFAQILKWNPVYNIHRLLILLFIIFCYLKFPKKSICNLLIVCILLQHIVLLLTHPDSRYAYLAWLLTFILFCYYLFNFYLKKLK